MSSDFYFFDQYSRVSHIGGILRSKRNSQDFSQALYHVKIASALENDHSNKSDSHTPITIKKLTNHISSPSISRHLKRPILPEILTKELDTVLQTFNEESKTNSPVSDRSKSPNEEELIRSRSDLPKVSLPATLIVQLHSTWFDLIKDTNYKHKVWRTKAGEDAWRRFVQRKRSQQLNAAKQEDICHETSVVRRRTSSRVSISSISSLSRRQSITANPKMRLSRTFSRASIFSTGNMLQDNLQLLKLMHQRTSEPFVEPIKNGIHVEFKLSTQDEETRQQIVLFDVPKPNVDLNEDIITSIQNRCKRLLAESKEKIRETTYNQGKKQTKIGRIWFYEDNQYVRNRSHFLGSNESNRRQKSKFVLSILRREIPEKFNIDIDIPQTKHKSYIELPDGSTQIYYPSGRLAVLRLRSPISTTLFFDDTDSSTHQFLGLVTSTGNVLLIQPTFYARFITNNQYDHGYLCNGKTGMIEKEFQWSSSNNYPRKSLPIDEENINPAVLDSTVQLQINLFMQLEYSNLSNILFAFTCQNEQFKFQLGTHSPRQSTVFINLATTILATRKLTGEKTPETSPKRSVSISSDDAKPHIQTRKSSNEQTNPHQLPMMQELTLLRKRIKHICLSWLEECRRTLGIMHVDAYHLPDLPSQSTVTQTKQQISDINRSHSAKEYHPETSSNNKFVKSLDRQQLLLPNKFEPNVIANVIEQYVPHSHTGRSIKQGIYRKKILPTPLSIIE